MTTEPQPEFTGMIDLAQARLGGRTLMASDEFFAEKENLLKPGRGVFLPDEYTDRGKWMDGWESRRKREPGHDWCIVKLGAPGVVHGVDIDTNHFTGNYPEHASVDALVAEGDPSGEELAARTDWVRLVPIQRLQGGSRNLFPVDSRQRWTHLRLNIYPDGGVARFRVHGQVTPDWERLATTREPIDLGAVENGGLAVLASDMYFSHRNNLLMPDRAPNMGDGWETKRKRGPGNDWCIVRLGTPGSLSRIEVDTHHFKGNFPESCSIEGVYLEEPEVPADFLANRNLDWRPILARTKLHADTRHAFENELQAGGPYSHIRLSIYPDGGVSRLRLWGRPALATAPQGGRLTLDELNRLAEAEAAEALAKCCGAQRWVEAVVNRRPFRDRTALFSTAEQAWTLLDREDWLEAFAHHPRIGDLDSLRAKFANTRDWASGEQAGAAAATEAVLQGLAEGNRAYEARFGHLFIVCATGKSAHEMLGLLRQRLNHDPETELRIAATEQARITQLRLEKLLV